MSDWQEYKEKIRTINSLMEQDIDEIVEISALVGFLLEKRQQVELSQSDLNAILGTFN